MPDVKRNLRLATIVYWVLLIYIVAALVWWALLLIQQNDDIANLQRVNLYAVSQGIPAQAQLDQIEVKRKRNSS